MRFIFAPLSFEISFTCAYYKMRLLPNTLSTKCALNHTCTCAQCSIKGFKSFLKRFLPTDSCALFILISSFPVYLGVYWHGFRCLRALILINTPDILVYLRIIYTSSAIRLANILTLFLAVIFVGSGLVHLLENSGDPWKDEDNYQEITIFECFYFLIVTMSTVRL